MVIERPHVPAVRELSPVDEDGLALVQNPCHIRVLVAVELQSVPIVGLFLDLPVEACLHVFGVELDNLYVVLVLVHALPVRQVVVPIVDLVAAVQDELLLADV